MKKALITGITGQDGSYLCELLLALGYEVHGIVRRTSVDPFERIESLRLGRLVTLHEGNLRDVSTIRLACEEVIPDEVYNLAAQSHVGTSFRCHDETWAVNYQGAGHVVKEAMRVNPDVRIYQASTSEMFGSTPPPQSEASSFNPVSPYAESKLQTHLDYVRAYRERHGLFICSGILFNHESPRRGKQFVTRKITHSFAKIKLGLQECVELGNLDARRDWGFAGDYVSAMHTLLQQQHPDDFVVATGETRTVREFAEAAARALGMELTFSGEGAAEVGRDRSGIVRLRVNPKFYRPAEVHYLQGNPSKAQRTLDWKPSVSFPELVHMMVKHDFVALSKCHG